MSSGTTTQKTISYQSAGVDIDAGDRAVEALKPSIRKTTRPEVVGGIGGFAGLFALDTEKYKKPLLASSTDGVGTKLVIAQKLDIHDTVGIDLVAMVVDDLVVCGAEPLFLLDYIATGQVVPEKIADIGAGIADGCRYAGCSLIGGEIAEHPGVMKPDDYDISATGVGVVEADELLGPERVKPGDVAIAMRASGLHSNGFSLVRQALFGVGGLDLGAVIPEFATAERNQRTLGEELLTPTHIYAKDCLELAKECDVHAFAHITGGGLAGNLVRSLPEGLQIEVDRGTWTPNPVFDVVQRTGGVSLEEMERTFNMGVGMVAIVAPDQVDRSLAVLTARHVEAWTIGEVTGGGSGVRLAGDYLTAG
ncbi:MULTISPECIES: phosphoribosylformylglycinamidine cyclo-ligase [Glycomyces]|uniref:Phosphoribosylformylglycinamidine cyclo-ligase n=1 Tax=Glycomyces artemisiae TaxID=1076443 RepID=A0A2T0URY8_9ACTN|nr:phosphoribosylformylglycinamidine cyclo-ligase [Glycomyces artemisiae]NUQ89164.1 phosphoribosylformylglycinamidine cyclo-ligase [Glycomyces artemisiae]PRY60695.1 phosphoribosylformylglycinamidine cyclo-ligase [Glycomyces artemisiae]